MATETIPVLGEERKFFDETLPELLQDCPGRVALVKGRALVGVFDTEEEALEEGARQFGLEPFLIRRVLPAPEEIRIPALTLGILRAHTPPTTWRKGPRS